MDDTVIIIIAFGILLLASMYLTLNRILLAAERRRNIELLKSSKTLTVPMRLQAYERLILFLERISPDTLLLKLKSQAMTNSDLHLAILQQIRLEYEHNISQQLYVSDKVWARVKETKERVVMFVNDVAKHSNPDTASIELAKQILDKLMEDGESPVSETIKEIKAEARKMFF
ncbi:MAG: hypothetical protein LBQ01_06155 [Prevotellaceae bacterium]|jgi:hypothetical protein|nr:hypothetical protein [Prevotellaceae bacterium]